MVEIEDVVASHTVQMVMMETKLDNITDGMNDMKAILREISSTQREMAILMERVENHEENTKKQTEDVRESFKAVHARITRVEEDNIMSKKFTQDKCDLITPMAKKAESVHTVMIFIAKSLGGLALTMLFGLMIWAIELGGAK